MTQLRSARQSATLILLGLILFFFGLLIGLFVHNAVNPRMALSAHLEGLMNGMFLLILGLIWTRLRLSSTWHLILFWLAVYGTFANLAAVIIAAVTGFGKMMPLAGGKEGVGFFESTISFLLVSLTLAMLAVSIIAICGAYRHLRQRALDPQAVD